MKDCCRRATAGRSIIRPWMGYWCAAGRFWARRIAAALRLRSDMAKVANYHLSCSTTPHVACKSLDWTPSSPLGEMVRSASHNNFTSTAFPSSASRRPDNDLEGTLLTFGFDSAVACATDALDRLHTTAESHNRVMVLEVMGRYAGWIALYAGVAGGADVILIRRFHLPTTQSAKNRRSRATRQAVYDCHCRRRRLRKGAYLRRRGRAGHQS
jgi:hypothetical protein